MLAPASTKNRLRVVSVAATLLLAAFAAAPSVAGATSASVTAYDSLAVLRPDRPAPTGGSSQVTVSAAGNEVESFQILVRATSGAISGLRVGPGDSLTGPGGATLPASSLTIYREAYYQVSQRSDAEGDTGSWPDALIPEKDDFYGEDRAAFPTDVASGGQLAAWIDVLVPQGQPAGQYAGSVRVTDPSGVVATVPVNLTVQDFSLPSTSTLKSAFLDRSDKICTAFTGSSNCNGNQDQAWQLQALFATAGLNNRVTIANPLAGSPNSSYFSKYIAPLIQGTDSRVRLPGAELTSVEAWQSCATSSGCLSDWKAAATKYGFADRFFLYNCDEPFGSSSAWSACAQTAQQADQAWPGVRKLVTAKIGDVQGGGGSSYTDIVAPVINDMAQPGGVNQRPAYDSFLASGSSKEMWLYTSCMSFSCDNIEDPYWNGWPGYAIDQPASQARAMGWLSFEYGATGELYWDSTISLPTAWTNQAAGLGGNGDGNLFYAGTPNGVNGSPAIGGTHDIPIESIRLKRIRDGREDYEYLHLLAQQGQASQAAGIVRGVFGSEDFAAHNTTVSSTSLNTARDQLAAAIAGQPVSVPPPAPAPSPAPTSSPTPTNPTTVGTAGDSSTTISTSPATGTTGTDLHLHVIKVKTPHSVRQLNRRGVRALVSCAVDCQVYLGSEVSRRAARMLNLGSTQIGTGSARVSANRPVWVTAKPAPRVRRKISRANDVKFSLRTEVRSRTA